MKKSLIIVSLITLLFAGLFGPSNCHTTVIPVTGFLSSEYLPRQENLSTLPKFVDKVANSGNSAQVAGVFVTGILEFSVLQQPGNNAGYVSRDPESVTQFAMVSQFDSIALLAHNDLAGQKFFDLKNNQILSLVYGDGQVTYYRITEILEYQALSPNSPYSSFIDLADPDGKVISVTDLFYKIYAQPDQLILQTCIEAEGQPSWGRLFIIAVPVAPFPHSAEL